MNKEVFSAVAEILEDESVKKLTTTQLFDQVILRRIIGLPGHAYGCRYRICYDFMKLVAEYGDELVKMDYHRGVVCLELALQRVACSTLFPGTPPYDYQEIPKEYSFLRARRMEYGTPNVYCWKFLKNQIERCLKLPETKEHAEKIMLGLISNISPEGNGIFLDDGSFDVDPKEARDWAYDTLYHVCGWQVIYDYFATPERYKKVPDLWLLNWGNINKKDLAKRLGIKFLFKVPRLKKKLGIV